MRYVVNNYGRGRLKRKKKERGWSRQLTTEGTREKKGISYLLTQIGVAVIGGRKSGEKRSHRSAKN